MPAQLTTTTICTYALGAEAGELVARMSGPKRCSARAPTARYRITNGFAIGALDRFIQIVLGRV